MDLGFFGRFVMERLSADKPVSFTVETLFCCATFVREWAGEALERVFKQS